MKELAIGVMMTLAFAAVTPVFAGEIEEYDYETREAVVDIDKISSVLDRVESRADKIKDMSNPDGEIYELSDEILDIVSDMQHAIQDAR